MQRLGQQTLLHTRGMSCTSCVNATDRQTVRASQIHTCRLTCSGCCMQELQHARSLLFHALGQPRSTDAVQRLYASAAPVQSSAAAMPSAEFRPGDFPWRLAESSMQVFESLAANGNAGLAWSMAGATCLASLMRCSPAHSSPLRCAIFNLSWWLFQSYQALSSCPVLAALPAADGKCAQYSHTCSSCSTFAQQVYCVLLIMPDSVDQTPASLFQAVSHGSRPVIS